MVKRKERNNKEFKGEESKNSSMVGRSKVLAVANNELSNAHAIGFLVLAMFRKL